MSISAASPTAKRVLELIEVGSSRRVSSLIAETEAWDQAGDGLSVSQFGMVVRQLVALRLVRVSGASTVYPGLPARMERREAPDSSRSRPSYITRARWTTLTGLAELEEATPRGLEAATSRGARTIQQHLDWARGLGLVQRRRSRRTAAMRRTGPCPYLYSLTSTGWGLVNDANLQEAAK